MDMLPLGSIVVVKGISQKGIIVGRYVEFVSNEQEPGGLKDYLAYPWPYGLSTGGSGDEIEIIQLGFNHEDIDIVVHKGYADAEDAAYLDGIAEAIADKIESIQSSAT